LFRFLSIFLISTYLIGTLGLKVNKHFCCGKLISMELLFGQTPKDCTGKPQKTPKKCCHNEAQTLQVDDAKKVISNLNLEPIQFSVFLPLVFPVFDFYLPSFGWTTNAYNLPHGPPISVIILALYLLHCSIII
jgi:hypothetical protein